MQRGLKPAPFLFAFIGALLLAGKAYSCDVCGCFIGVLPYDNQSSLTFLHSYRIFSGYETIPGQFFPSGAYRLATPPSALHGTSGSATVTSARDFESYKAFELRGKWFIHPRVSLDFYFPWVINKSNTSGGKLETSGMGDVTLLAGYDLIRKMKDEGFRHRLVVGLGVKLPTGNCSAKDENGERIPALLQAGTGTTDLLAYLAYTGGGKMIRWGATVAGKYGSTNRYGETPGKSISSSATIGHLLTLRNFLFYPQLQAYQELAEPMQLGIARETGTEMNCLLAGPGLNVYYKNASAGFAVQFPVYDNTESYNLLNKGRFVATMTWGFNQSRYLFQSKKQ